MFPNLQVNEAGIKILFQGLLMDVQPMDLALEPINSLEERLQLQTQWQLL